MLILLNGVGSFFGPFIATLFMSFYGPSAFFGSVGAIYIGICLFALYRAAVNPKVVSVEDQGDYLSVHPRATPVVAQIAEEVIEE
jgi:dipeptide/tripeptide permease